MGVKRLVRHGAAASRIRLMRLVNERAGAYRQKVFCIGRNKTGTTTMDAVLRYYGFRMGPQHEAERFVHEHRWVMQKPFWDWVAAHEAFQDVPFSNSWFLPELYARYPDARYILTLREPADWFESLTNHHLGAVGLHRGAARAEIARRLRDNSYVAPGWLYRNHVKQFAITSDAQLYDRDRYIRNYEDHTALVRRTVPAAQLLEIDLAKHPDTAAICRFLGLAAPALMKTPMPWRNRRK